MSHAIASHGGEPARKPVRRRRLTFSLRMLLALMVATGVFLGVVVDRVRRQQAAVAWIQAHGGFAFYEYELDREGAGAFEQPPTWKWIPLPNTWKAWLGRDVEWSVTVVALNDEDERTMTDLTPLAGLYNLRSLNLAENPVSDLTPLAGLKRLQRLNLGQTQVRDLQPLAGLTDLECLNLFWTPVSQLEPLAGLTKLEYLNVAHTEVQDLAPLGSLSNLRELYADQAPADEADLAALKRRLPRLLTKNPLQEHGIDAPYQVRWMGWNGR